MKSQLMQNMLPLAGATLLATGLLVACQNINYPTPTPASGPSTALARFTFVNASPDASAVNFYIDNVQVGTGSAISTTPLTASYVNGQAGGGGVELRAKAASGSIGGVVGSSDILYRSSTTGQGNFATVAGNSYTVFLTDSLNRPKPTVVNGTNLGGPQFLVVTDTLTAPATGNAKVRFFNLAPDVTGIVSSTVTAVSARLAPLTGTQVTTFTNRTYRTVTGTPARYTTVPAGTYIAQVYLGTTVPTSSTVTPIASGTVTLADSKIYTLYSQGLRRKNTLSVGSVQHN